MTDIYLPADQPGDISKVCDLFCMSEMTPALLVPWKSSWEAPFEGANYRVERLWKRDKVRVHKLY
jgi:hypothetical protein